MIMLYRKGGPGFTLIELLVVIAVIALLAGLLFPVLSLGREKALSSHCRNNLRQLRIATRLYADANGERLPSMRNADLVVHGRPARNQAVRRTLRAEAGAEEVFQCRKDRSETFRDGGSSYQWNAVWNGKLIDQLRPGEPFLNQPWLFDSEPRHGRGGGGRNAVYMDGRVREYGLP